VSRLALLLAVAALLAPSGASAKELVAATVCGASGCRTVTDRGTLNEIPGGEDVTGLGAPAAYYRLNLVMAEPNGRPHGFTTYYVPSAEAMSWSEDGIYRLHPIYGPRANGVMRRITASLEPYAAPRITAAIVGIRRVTGAAAASYASLFTVGEPTQLDARPYDWVAVDLRSNRPSPWTDGKSEVVFSPSTNLVEIGYEPVRIPEGVADDLAAGRALVRGAGSKRPLGVGRARGSRGSRRLVARSDSAFQVVIQHGRNRCRRPS
jgi:hypothetical protein